MAKIETRLKFTFVLVLCAATATGVLSAQGSDPNRNQPSAPAYDDVIGVGEGGVALEDIRLDLSNLVNTTGGNWNNIGSLNGTTSNLIDFNTGGGTGVGITGSGWSDFFGDDGGTFPNQDWLIQPATRDGAGLQDGQFGTLEITALTSGEYRIEVVTARTCCNYLNTIRVNGAQADRTFLASPVQDPWGSLDDGLTPGNWLIWDNVSPVGGTITITNSAENETLAMINAVRVLATVIPVELEAFEIE